MERPAFCSVVIQKCLRATYGAAAIIFVLYSGSSSAVHAAVFDVDTIEDDGALRGCTSAPNDCSLRGAIIKANLDAVIDTITLTRARYVLRDGELHVTTSMYITGADAQQSIIDGQKNDRVFRMTGLVDDINVIIVSITITGGKSGENGGGIKLESFSTLTLADSMVTDNRANDGGGLHLSPLSTLKLIKSTIGYNAADATGGGIHLEFNSMAALTDSYVLDNQADSGGGIFTAQFSTLALAHSTIGGNAANGNGGGIHNNQTMFVTNSSIMNNHADADETGNGDGGGIFNNGLGTITNSRITNNIAVKGGGIFLNAGSLGISHSTISHNTANDGGGLFNKVIATIAHSAIVNNAADLNGNDIGNGGGLFNSGVVILDHVPIKANKAFKGNAVYNEDTLVLMGNVTFEGSNACDNDTTGVGCP